MHSLPPESGSPRGGCGTCWLLLALPLLAAFGLYDLRLPRLRVLQLVDTARSQFWTLHNETQIG